MPDSLEACLNDLEHRLDDVQEQVNLAAWQRFCDGSIDEPIFVPPARRPARPFAQWPDIHINDAQDDIEQMVFSQFKSVSDEAAAGSNMRFCVRCNYGTGILPSLFGCELFRMPRETCTLPTAMPHHSREKMRELVANGPPDIRSGLGARVFDCAERFLEIFKEHPKLARHVWLFHPDMQGPIDAAEVIWGSDIFLAFYDEPELLMSLLDLITDTYIAFMRQWYAVAPASVPAVSTAAAGPYSVHWGLLHKGRLMIRNDSLMNLSPELYVEFVQPHDQRLLDEFGGGAIHFCGRGSHYIPAISHTRGLFAINLSQPHLNDMEAIFASTIDKGIRILDLDRGAAQAALDSGRALRGHVHCRK
ncbi:MAG TPA: hypothetical protein VGP72_29970 [Planctomycetota bacterium]|jgi:hypothetical protein